jgi:hypothetical protein
MASYTSPRQAPLSAELGRIPESLRRVRPSRGSAVGLLMLAALIAFELFNFSTTEYALADLMGDLGTAGIRWATVLALAFCAMDFAGIARLLTPQAGRGLATERGYLIGAWGLAAAMNAALTWYAVSLALLSHAGLGGQVLGREAMLRGVPLFVAVLVLLVRVLIIGSFSLSGGRLFSQAERTTALLRPKAHASSHAQGSANGTHSSQQISSGSHARTPAIQRMAARPSPRPR